MSAVRQATLCNRNRYRTKQESIMNKLYAWLFALLTVTCAGTAIAAEDVLLGPGDVMKVSVFGNPDLGLETKISETGTVSFPLLGDVSVAGLTPSAAEKKLAGLLQSGGYLRKAEVTIAVSVAQSQQLSVLGYVNRPGRYAIDGKRMLTDVLALAGGVNADGGDTATLIRTRDGKTNKEVIDLLDMVRSADFKHNAQLQGGDVIYVERAPKFYIYGEVQRPGAYRLDRNMTVVQALSSGGGLTPRGTERGLRIKRRDADGKLQVLNAKHDDVLQADDVVYVQESLF
jgi:polysaccharide export outer membrane protein